MEAGLLHSVQLDTLLPAVLEGCRRQVADEPVSTSVFYGAVQDTY